MNYIIFDSEVFAKDWIFDFKMVGQDNHYTVHNDNGKIKYFFKTHRDSIFVSFNGKHYDHYILKAVLNDFTAEEVKEVNDYIINGGNGWECPLLKPYRMINFNYTDLMDDCQVGTSLKSFEAHSGMNIVETEISFDIPRCLTNEELELVIKYCKYDVDATEKLFNVRESYLSNKISVGSMANLSEEESLKLTNAKLTAKYLKAKPIKTSDERSYEFPKNINWKYIPPNVKAFYEQMKDENIKDEDLFASYYESNIGRCTYKLAFGGIHGDIKHSIFESNDSFAILNMDVGSYYPHLITINNYVSRAIANAKDYEIMLETRMKAKKEGNKKVANALKLVCNSTYGAFGDKYNDLYDPLMMRSVCISGQLYLLELAIHCHKETGCEIIQLNTDGIMIYISRDMIDVAMDIFNEWQTRTGFELEQDNIVKIVQKSVNEYLAIYEDGSSKSKGGYLVRGIAKAGAFKINNNYNIVCKAVSEYFTKGIYPESTIMNCNDPFEFQIIAKSTGLYERTYQLIDGQEVDVQRCNRVYATRDWTYGTLYKIHKTFKTVSKMANIPDHCIVDNANTIDITDIDKRWYINLAYKYINDFIGEENGCNNKHKNVHL